MILYSTEIYKSGQDALLRLNLPTDHFIALPISLRIAWEVCLLAQLAKRQPRRTQAMAIADVLSYPWKTSF
ncbi:hypothetical protein [Leptolyngbya sp. FACHB-711]|uniref:hypothetical protein n=1 Tax=unclassified Leptolyngbya TaxID=2650499 RepID=UPI0016852B63|nr:hypothetical protein [Leptolyngbya sp. FACHB-711]MBD1850363.1 hypothetical protein [Cyanobacteria bacterium FACHB-502]MBD2024087.1 hypothetical protein [Leptolyngbya sp. FACHB-711]